VGTRGNSAARALLVTASALSMISWIKHTLLGRLLKIMCTRALEDFPTALFCQVEQALLDAR